MRMDRYEDNRIEENEDDIMPLSRMERNKKIYNNAYDSSKVVDIKDYLGDKKMNDNHESDNEELKTNPVFEEKNYDVEEYLKNAHNNAKPDKNVRNLDNKEFKDQEDEISKLIASIDDQKENDEFFTDLLGDDEDTIIEGQLTKEEITRTTYEEFYENEFNQKKKIEIDSTKLEKALGEETMAKLELDEDAINNTFQDIYKVRKMSKKKKKLLAITIFSVSLFALIVVILIIILA